MIGGNDTDNIYGEEGDDFIIGFYGNDEINGGEGNNTVSYSYSDVALTVNLSFGFGRS